MIYVTSDLHGYPLADFQRLLEQAHFSQDDFLFVLGDVVDRGPEGAQLLRWMAGQPNVQLILGNHEAMLLSCRFLFDAVTDESLDGLTLKKMELLQTWMENGAAPTLSGLRQILKEDPAVMDGILEYLQDAPLYEVVTARGRTFVLVHAGLGNFAPDKPLEDYVPEELLWTRPMPDTRYFDSATVILGHTPTGYYGPQYRGIAMKTPTWICIDTGAADGKDPMLLRLDDLQEFYL